MHAPFCMRTFMQQSCKLRQRANATQEEFKQPNCHMHDNATNNNAYYRALLLCLTVVLFVLFVVLLLRSPFSN